MLFKSARTWLSRRKSQPTVLVKSEVAPVEDKFVFRFTKPLSISREAPGEIIISNHIDDEVIVPVSAGGPRFPVPSIAGVSVPEQNSSVPRYPALWRFQTSSTSTVARSSTVARKSAFDICVILMIVLVMYSLIVIFDIFWRDVDGQSEKHTLSVHFDAMWCSREYIANQCETHRIPGTAEMCLGWEKCMSQSSAQIVRMKIISSLVAGFIEDFVGRLSYRTLAVLFSVAFSCWLKIKIQA